MPFNVNNTVKAGVSNWYSQHWDYSKKIVIDHTKVSATLTNFPVLIDNISASFSHAQADGDDFVFVAANNVTKYNHEIESFASNHLVAWVNVISLSSTVDTVIWLYYGNPSCSSQQNKVGTWDANYVMVQHMNDVTTSTILDSTSNANNGAKKAANEPIVTTSGKIGCGQYFDGINDYIDITGASDTRLQGNVYTFSTWMYIIKTGANDYSELYSVVGYGSGRTGIKYGDGNAIGMDANADFYGIKVATENLKLGWHQITAIINRTDTMFLVYVDGTYKGNDTFTTYTPACTGVRIGGNQLTGNPLDYTNGTIDETRLSNVVRSASWISTEYNNQDSPSTFLTVGNEQSRPVNWYNHNWFYSKKIVIDHTKVSATLTNFPVLIDNTSASFSNAQADGDDFVFVAANNITKYNHEIESFASNHLVAWVNVTSLSSTEDTVIYMYYGNTICSNQENPTGVWDANYTAVWHMDDLTTSTIDDSTSYNHDGTKAGANTPYEADGTIGKAQACHEDGIATFEPYLNNSKFTINFWYKKTGSHYGDGGTLVCQRINPDLTISLWRITEAKHNLIAYGCKNGIANKLWNNLAITGVSNNTWHYVSLVSNHTHITLYCDGQSSTVSFDNPIPDMSSDANHYRLAKSEGYSYYGLWGLLDESRVSNTNRNSSWLLAEYYNQNSSSTFYTLGSEDSPSVDVSLSVTPSAEANITVEPGTWDGGGANIGENASTATNAFWLNNTGLIQVDVTISASNTSAWHPGTSPGHNQFQLQYGIVSSWTNITEAPLSFINNLAWDEYQQFGLKLYMPTSSSTNAEQTATITFEATVD